MDYLFFLVQIWKDFRSTYEQIRLIKNYIYNSLSKSIVLENEIVVLYYNSLATKEHYLPTKFHIS